MKILSDFTPFTPVIVNHPSGLITGLLLEKDSTFGRVLDMTADVPCIRDIALICACKQQDIVSATKLYETFLSLHTNPVSIGNVL